MVKALGTVCFSILYFVQFQGLGFSRRFWGPRSFWSILREHNIIIILLFPLCCFGNFGPFWMFASLSGRIVLPQLVDFMMAKASRCTTLLDCGVHVATPKR